VSRRVRGGIEPLRSREDGIRGWIHPARSVRRSRDTTSASGAPPRTTHRSAAAVGGVGAQGQRRAEHLTQEHRVPRRARRRQCSAQELTATPTPASGRIARRGGPREFVRRCGWTRGARQLRPHVPPGGSRDLRCRRRSTAGWWRQAHLPGRSRTAPRDVRRATLDDAAARARVHESGPSAIADRICVSACTFCMR
jgi:hypothetical protein